MTAAGTDGDFWSWSLAFYERPGVADSCLALQDRCAADVNLLLLGLWLAGAGMTLDAASADAILAWAEPWQRDVVAPLRAARRGLKLRKAGGARAEQVADLDALRRQLAAVELEAERLEQAELERLAGSATATTARGSALAVATWRQLLGSCRLDPEPARHLLATAFPEEMPAARETALG